LESAFILLRLTYQMGFYIAVNYSEKCKVILMINHLF
jgi:hypothetical protein